MTRRNTVDDFWAKVKKSDGCWEWQGGTRGPQPHGRIKMGGGKFISTHRLSWELAYGPIPEGTHVCHRCDNPPCVRPDHLFLGTAADNAHDRDAKGRTSRGVQHLASMKVRRGSQLSRLLTEEDVAAIRRRLTGRFGEQAEIAREYGIDPSVVSRIANRQRWTHV